MISLFLAAFLAQATYIDLYNSGHTLLDEGRVKEAEAVLKESASLNPRYVPALKALAESYVRLKRFNEAIELYNRVIEINPKDASARGDLAELYSWAGDYDKSIVTYRDAIERDPRNLGLKTGLAKVLRWSQRYDEAERLYNEVIRDDPENHDALKGLAKTYSMRGDLTNSLTLLEKAIKLYPVDAELYKEQGTVLGWQKDFKKAVVSLKKAIELSPGYTDAYKTLGDVYSWMKVYPQAIESYRRAIDLEPANHENFLLLAGIYKASGNTALAEESIKAALKISPSDSQALDMLRELREEGKYPLIKDFSEALEIFGFALAFAVIVLVGRSRKRMLRRRHRAYFYFINIILPALVLTTFVSFIWRDFMSHFIDTSILEEFAETVLFLSLGSSFFALLWTDYRSKEFARMKILAVGAHPDDIELGCGGFILKAKDSGARVFGLTVTKGEKGSRKNGDREKEARRAARFMELDGHWALEFSDTGLQNSIAQMKDAIEEKIKETGATVVLTHSAIDIHADHQAVFEATKVAARNISLLCYEDVSTPKEFVPNYYVDITAYIEDKAKLIAFHKTQGDKTYMDPEVIKGRAAHRGLQSGVQYAEAFRIHKFLL